MESSLNTVSGLLSLFHNAGEHTGGGSLLDYMNREGRRLVLVLELICEGGYSIGCVGRQCPCA